MNNQLEQNLLLSGNHFVKQLDYWSSKLVPQPVTELLTPNLSEQQAFDFAELPLVIEADTASSIRNLSRNTNLSIYVIFVSVVKVLINKYTGKALGTVVSPVNLNVSSPEWNRWVPIQDVLDDHLTFKDVLLSVGKSVLGAYNAQDYPVGKYIHYAAESDVESDRISYVLCRFVDIHGDSDLQLPEDISFCFERSQEGFNAHIRYDRSRFDQAFVQQLSLHFLVLVNKLLINLDKKIGEINIFSAQEYKELLFNAPQTELPVDSLLDQFLRHCKEIPCSVAVEFGSLKLTYEQLDQKSSALAEQLMQHGINEGDLVAVISSRSPLTLVSVLSIWKAGGVYLPIDPQLPAERMMTMLRHAEPKLLLIGESHNDVLNIADVLFSVIVLTEELFKHSPSPDFRVASQKNNSLAYVMYTSGSTGIPKGVMIEHRGMLNHLMAKVSDLQISQQSVVIQNAAVSFDISIWQFFAPLSAGGRVIIIPETVILDIELFCGQIRDTKATILEVVPSYLSVMLEYLERVKIELQLDYLLVTGEILRPQLMNRWLALYPDTKIVNAYGPTEASDDITHYITSQPIKYGSVPIGKAIQNMNVFILNENLALCPKGLKGQIAVSGVGVARGYLHDPGRTAEVFINHPFDPSSDFKVYLTGDYGRLRNDGLIEYFGRQDQQVKINGHRIEIGEIEQALIYEKGIKEFVVKALSDEAGQKYLCGYYSFLPNYDLSNEDIKSSLARKLPGYMIPAYLIHMPVFPVTPNGKIDRKQLPVPKLINLQHADSDTSFVNRIEQQLADLWKLVLDVTHIRSTDNFFDLGGHSLSVAKLIVHLHKEFNAKISYEDVFRYPTIAELAPILAQKEIQSFEPILPVGYQELYSVSTSQKRLWIIHQMEDEKFIYNIPQSYILNGKLDFNAFNYAMEQLVDRHEILRTVFVNQDGEPMQQVRETADLEPIVQFQDISGQPDWELTVRRLVQEEEKYPFDLEKGPLLRAILVKVQPEKHILLFTIHHIIADGWSFEVIKADVFDFYSSFANEDVSLPAPLTIQYKDYAAWQKKQMQSASFLSSRQYWLDQFSNEAPILDLPTDYPRPKEKTYHGRSIDVSLGKKLSKDLVEFTQVKNVSLFMFLLSAVKVLMYKYSNQTDMIIGTPNAGRIHQHLDNQIGFYINLLPIRTVFEHTTTFDELLSTIKEKSLLAYQNSLYPFDHLINELSLERDLSRSPLFDVLVVLQNANTEKGRSKGMRDISIDNFPLTRTVVKYDLSFNFAEEESEISLSLEYNSDVYAEERMIHLIEHFKNIIQSVILNEHGPLRQIEYLSSAEIAKLDSFNNTMVNYGMDRNIVDLLDEQVERTPDATALNFADQKLTYRQLQRLSSQFAQFLVQEKGIKSGDNVAVVLERSVFSVIAMIGILKSGACYLPVDVLLPESRIAFILADSQSKVVICNRTFLYQSVLDPMNTVWVEDFPLNGQVDNKFRSKPCASSSSYVIYTSGSTGEPKGVVQTHKTLYNLISWQSNTWLTDPGYRFLQHASFSFDASLHDILYSLSVGGELFLLPEDIRADFKSIKEFIIKNEIHVIWFTFSSLVALFDEFDTNFKGVALKHVVTTGEAASLDNSIGAFISAFPDVMLHNFYGPSETHVVTSYTFNRDLIPSSSNLPIGNPISNTRIFILDDVLHSQPIGVPGMIYVESDNVFNGYLNQEDLTAKVCIPNPFKAGTVLYHTGDVGRWLFDGNIEFLGRKDRQVKIRGFRVELKEIEALISKFEGVEGTVVTYTSQRGSSLLIAYIISRIELNKNSLYNFLHQSLPEYMIPVHFVTLESFPLTANGKIDLKSLPLTETSLFEQKVVSPTTDTEDKLLCIWKEILGKESVSTVDSFFKIGGHSLTATRMAAKIFKEFNADINLKTIYKYSTITELAAEIDTVLWFKNSEEDVSESIQKLII